MGLKAAVQALKKAEALKDKVQQCKDLLNDHDAWVSQQQLQKIYQQVLILDLEYALDRKVEQELWNLGFKNYIATLQTQAKDRKNPKRGESQAMLSWCLEAASGFYLTLLQEMCTAFDLDLPFRRKSYVYGCTPSWKVTEKIPTPHKSSCFYACQYCLVHLGDIARYRNQNKQAELFYRHAVSLSPSSGQPYNQLALLEASRGDKLGTVFHYVRSVAVKHPFSVATANLAKILSSAMNDNTFNVEGKTKLTSQEYVAVFLKLHSILHNLGEVTVASKYVALLTETMTALVATESFSSWRLVQMLAINLYALQHAIGVTTDSVDTLKIDQLSADEKIARDCILDLIAGSLSALLLPIYTIKGAVLEYFALPTIKLCLDWICMKPSILEESAFATRLQIWPSLCLLLNGLQSSTVDFKHDQYAKIPLPEDRDLQGFLPLEKAFASIQFASTDLESDVACLNKLRAVRILNLARQLSQQSINGASLISIGKRDEEGREQFTAVSETAGLSKELWKELEELSLNKERQPLTSTSPVPSESASSKGSWETDILESTAEKRVGILKPQGSLERSRDSATSGTDSGPLEANTLHSIKKPRQNVAMQAIMRRAETEQKQVTFKNSSPVLIEQESGKVKPTPGSPSKNGVPKIMQPAGQQPSQNYPSHSTQPNAASIPTATRFPGRNQGQPITNPKLQIDLQQAALANQYAPAESQQSASFGGQSQTSFDGQPFNVQNPQFGKNFMAAHHSSLNQYQIPSQNMPAMPQNQNRNHQRIGQSAQMIGQNILAQQSIGTNAPLNMRSASGLQNVEALQAKGRTNRLNVQSQMSVPLSNLANSAQSLQNLANYQKNYQQSMPITNPSNAPNLTNAQSMNYNPNFGQNAFNQMYQKQMSPVAYNANAAHFNFPNQSGAVKAPATANYQRFPAYDNKDFNVWKNTQPPQPPVTWWGSAGASQVQGKEIHPDVFQNWPANPPSVSVFGNVQLGLGDNYHQNSMHSRQYSRNTIDEARPYEMDQKHPQSPGAGNTYSLFSGNTWGVPPQPNLANQDQVKNRHSQQSLWSGPGPSPLERLLEQQKSLREGGT